MADKLPPAVSPPLEVVILAAGQGTRMRSTLPKVLHCIGGKPMLSHVIDAVSALQPRQIHVVVGNDSDQLREQISGTVSWITQADQLGTGHAVMQALPEVADDAIVLVVYGDVPLISSATLAQAHAAAADGALALVTAEFADPAQLGRIIRGRTGAIESIVEFADASAAQRSIAEINSGIMALQGVTMKRLLARVQPQNAQGEYYLTDLIGLAVADGIPISGIVAECADDVVGVNDRYQLAQLERIYQQRRVRELMAAGVTVADPARLDIRGTVSAGRDCFIDINVLLEGNVTLGQGVSIGPGCVIRDSSLADGVRVEAHTVIDGAQVAADCQLGPFARLRPGTDLKEQVKIGNFVEVKKTTVGRGSKASHLTYLGDATLGEDCNVGAGTVTCNYDGVNKLPTTIGDRVFVGTNSTLVAPVVIEDDAYVAAGSTITTRVGDSELAVGRGRQRNINGWVRPDRRKPKES